MMNTDKATCRNYAETPSFLHQVLCQDVLLSNNILTISEFDSPENIQFLTLGNNTNFSFDHPE